MNKSEWDGAYIIFESKICISKARNSDLALITEEDKLKIYTIFFYVHWQGPGWNYDFA